MKELVTGFSQHFSEVYYAIILETGKQKMRQRGCQKHLGELRI